MKKTSLMLALLPGIIFSCTTENINDEDKTDISDQTTSKIASTLPDNPANPYDDTGRTHNDILDIYHLGMQNDSTVAQVRERIILIKGDIYPCLIDDAQIRHILSDPYQAFELVVQKSSLSGIAKMSLSNFITSFTLLEDSSYENIYQFIILYEANVSANTQFSNIDKRIILRSTSILRFSLYYEKKRKDKDWDSSVGNFVGGVSGSVENSVSAVNSALVVGICQRNQVAQ